MFIYFVIYTPFTPPPPPLFTPTHIEGGGGGGFIGRLWGRVVYDLHPPFTPPPTNYHSSFYSPHLSLTPPPRVGVRINVAEWGEGVWANADGGSGGRGGG